MTKPVGKQRLTHTIGYFIGCLAFTRFAVRLLKNSALPNFYPSWRLIFTSLGLLIGTQMVNYYHENPVLKHLLKFIFEKHKELSMVPLISMAAIHKVNNDSLFAAGFTMALLGLAFNGLNE